MKESKPQPRQKEILEKNIIAIGSTLIRPDLNANYEVVEKIQDAEHGNQYVLLSKETGRQGSVNEADLMKSMAEGEMRLVSLDNQTLSSEAFEASVETEEELAQIERELAELDRLEAQVREGEKLSSQAIPTVPKELARATVSPTYQPKKPRKVEKFVDPGLQRPTKKNSDLEKLNEIRKTRGIPIKDFLTQRSEVFKRRVERYKEKESARESKEETQRQEADKKEEERILAMFADQQTHPFKYFVLGNMDSEAFQALFLCNTNTITLEDINRKCGEDGEKLDYFEFNTTLHLRNNIAYMSSNGFGLQLVNAEEIASKGTISASDIQNPKAKYRLIDPRGKGKLTVLPYEKGVELLKAKAEEYQESLRSEFQAQNQPK